MVARVGGILLVVGSPLAATAVVIAIVVSSWADGAGALVKASIGLLGAGAAAVSVAGPSPLGSRLTRVGLGIFALGLLSFTVASIVGADLRDEALLQSGPFVISMITGVVASAIGTLTAGLSLARSPGRPQIVGFGLLGGLLIPFSSLIGIVLLTLGCAGVGLLALGVGLPRENAST